MRTRKRRGMLLLVVLALLAMFAMLAVAFVVMTGSERDTSIKIKGIESQLDPPAKSLDAAAAIVVRGGVLSPSSLIPTGTSACPIGPICLMEKIVGSGVPQDLIYGQIKRNDLLPVAGGQLLTLNVPDAMHVVGCTVTMLTGPAAGLSTKIVGLKPVPAPQAGQYQVPTVVHILPFEGNVMPQKGNLPTVQPDQYVINGFPYSGAGFGYNPKTGALDAPGAYGPLALEPRNPLNMYPAGGANCDYTAPDFQDPLLAYATPGTAGSGVMVPIPSLHRADLIQHWMAATNKGSPLTANQMRLLSYRPIGAQKAPLSNNAYISDTPDHPYFNGSNPNFNPMWDGQPYDANGKPVSYRWDVDNMGRGTPDSVWVDLGFPVRFTSDGRAYKPLFAILCLDLDGRLNVNAHGNLAQTQQSYYQPEALPYQPITLPGNVPLGDMPLPAPQPQYAGKANAPPAQQQAQLIRGQGYGPAEINLAPLFSTPPTSPASPLATTTSGSFNFNLSVYQTLLQGSKNTIIGDQLGRYGETDIPNGMFPSGALAGSTTAGYSPLTWNRWFSYSENWQNDLNGTSFDAWGSPPDTQGLGAIGLDVAGRPLYISMGGLVKNTPYDIDLSRNAARATGASTPDSPYSVAELERLLRAYDRDAITLPGRLLAVTSLPGQPLSSSFLLQHPAIVTTESESVPVATTVVPAPLLSQQARANFPEGRTHNPVDAAAAAMLATGNAIDWGAVADLLPWEVLHGLKMNINRPFGPGAAGTRATVGTPVSPTTTLVDADQPTMTGGSVQLYVSPNVGTNGVKSEPFYYDGSGTLATDSRTNPNFYGNSLAARQTYAKHLYVLMMMSVDLQGIDAQTGSRDASARLIAQWAVNVVAYRDHNSIMIPFSYDVYPFGDPNNKSKKPGWAPDYTESHTVWGCKRPDLLITETLAFHDRRTEDTSNEVVDPANQKYGADPKRKTPGTYNNPPAPPNKDPNFDQHYRPQGSLFVELYNPWTALEAQPRDLLMGAPTYPNGVNLSQTTGQRGGSPVWRLIIVNPTQSPQISGELRDPDDPVLANRPVIERAAYFVPGASIAIPPDVPVGSCYFASTPTGLKPPVIVPGGYAVIGSGESSAGSPNRRQTLIGLDSSKKISSRAGRYITLDPNEITAQDSAGYKGFLVKNNSFVPPTGFTPPPPATVVVDTAFDPATARNIPRRLSVSEPVGGYGLYEHTPKGAVTYSAATETYSDTIDIPFDFQRSQQGGADAADAAKLLIDGTTTHFRVIYLQRLADPTRPYAPINNATIGNNSANPYRTIDAMPVDLTAFNGVSPPTAKDPNVTTGATHFEARQRGNTVTNGAQNEFNVWKQEALNKTTWAPYPGDTKGGNFNKGLTSTLGYLNSPYYSATLAPMSQGSAYWGDPSAPFPWLNWAYRPFVNEYELLLVPAVSSSKLLARNDANPRKYYGYVDQSARPGTDSFTPTPSPPNPNLPPMGPLNSSYPHLLGMFQSGPVGQSAQFYRVLSYLGVPTPFAHFTVQANPDYTYLPNTQGPGPHWFNQPFNGIPTYREPGRINLNTISSSDVFMGLLNFHPGLANANMWQKFVESRRGDTNTDMTINPALPSRFMRPFRSAGGFWLTPPTADGKPAFPGREIDATMMREDPTVPGRPLLQVDDVSMQTTTSNAGGTPEKFGADVTAYQPYGLASTDFNRNPYFRYQGLQKLAGTTTTHSNVFAIWITVGYFEVTPATNPNAVDPNTKMPIYPDGYQLGQELGADTGDVVRHRAFYIFDRSLPLGYIRGQDVNTAKGFLLQRFIE